MYVVYDDTSPNVIYGPFSYWDEAVTFADHVLMAGINTEIRLLIDPLEYEAVLNKYKSTANE